jgi:hypothetical protein
MANTNESIVYTPLLARVVENKNKPGQLGAFVEKQFCFFEPNTDLSSIKVGDEVEVMITCGRYRLHPEGHEKAGQPDWNSLIALNLGIVDKSKFVIAHLDGFEQFVDEDTNKSSVTSHGDVVIDGKKYEVEVSAGKTSAIRDTKEGKLIPMTVWLSKEDVLKNNDEVIVAKGLTRLQDGRWWRLIKKYYYTKKKPKNT